MPIPPLRVAVVARAVMPLHGIGGLERSVRDLVRHLARLGVDVTLITPPPSVQRDLGPDPFGSPNIRLRHVSYVTFPGANRRGTTILDRSTAYLLFGWRAGRLARSLATAGEVDLVHGFGASVLGYAGRRRPVPLVFNPQGLEEFGATATAQPRMKRVAYAPLRWAVRRSARAAARIIATDVSLEPMVTRHLRPAPGQLCTIPNGIDLLEAAAMAGPADGAIARQRAGIGTNEFVWLSAGRLEHNKGFDVLARALGRASAAGGPLAGRAWRWVIIGTGPFRRDIERVVEEQGLHPHVLWLGRVSDADLHAWFEGASVFAHPTRYEGSSLVTLEAMAHRKPVVAARAGGLPDKVRPGVNGWLVEPGDVAGLADALADAMAATAHLATMGEHSREIVEQEFAWPVIARRHLAMYADVLGTDLVEQ
jgi:glycogen(starch) synthase